MFKIKIADVVVEIDNIYDIVEKQCQDYKTDEPAAFTVKVDETQIDRELADSKVATGREYAESVCIYREICFKMIDYNAFLFHSSVIECDGKAYAFAAKSGVGKTTHTLLWVKRYGDRVKYINGDKPLMRIVDGKVMAYGTPWSGKEGQQRNTCAPLAGICFLERGKVNNIHRQSSIITVSKIFNQLILPDDKTRMEKLFKLLDFTINHVPCYNLTCNISEDAAEVAYMAMVEGKVKRSL